MKAKRVEELSPERIAECHSLGEALWTGVVEARDVPLPRPSIDTAWLNTIEREIFAAAVPKDAIEREYIQSEWGALRLLRRLADDDVTRVREWCERTAAEAARSNPRLQRLMAALRSYVPLVPAHGSRSLH